MATRASLTKRWHRYVQLSLPEHGRSDVIVWPETAIPAFYQDVLPFLEALGEKAREDRVDYVTGIPTGSWETSIFHNSVISVGRSLAFYSKRRLLPFGEYLPLRWFFLFFRDWVTIPMADFTPGDRDQPLLRAGGQPVGVSICFEAVFGSEIRRALPEATWLINVSNDAWFKDSTAPHQHLQIARMRALEVGPLPGPGHQYRRFRHSRRAWPHRRSGQPVSARSDSRRSAAPARTDPLRPLGGFAGGGFDGSLVLAHWAIAGPTRAQNHGMIERHLLSVKRPSVPARPLRPSGLP